MQLKLKRSERRSSFSGSTIYCLDALAEFSPPETALVHRQQLMRALIYKPDTEFGVYQSKADAIFKAHLTYIDVDSLIEGHHLESRSLQALSIVEDGIMAGCKALQLRLDAASLYKGQERVIDFGAPTPGAVARAEPPADDDH